MKWIKLFEDVTKATGELNPNLPKLRYNIKTVVMVEFEHLDDFINEVYDIKGYSVISALITPNEVSHEIYVDSENIYDGFEDDIIDLIEGDFNIDLNTILTDLARKKLIPDKCIYIIHVSW